MTVTFDHYVKTTTSQHLAAEAELEAVDDLFCDLYADGKFRDADRERLGRAIDRLRAWRHANGYASW